MVKAICANLEIAMPLDLAAESEGVGRSTRPWLDEMIIRSFLDGSRAHARGVRRTWSSERSRAERARRKRAGLLERRYREDYGPVNKIEHSGPNGKSIEIEADLGMAKRIRENPAASKLLSEALGKLVDAE